MANRCYCGRSQMMPYCDGSHDGREAPAAPAPAATQPPAPARAEPVEPVPRRGWLARLFGKD